MKPANIAYLAAGSRRSQATGALALLGAQDVELENVREHMAFYEVERGERKKLEGEEEVAYGELIEEHFASMVCKKCSAPLKRLHPHPWPKWYCDYCGHVHFDTHPVFVCSQNAESCNQTFCTKCYVSRCIASIKSSTPPPRDPTPPPPERDPTPPPEPSPSRGKRKVRKKPKPEPVAMTPSLDTIIALEREEAVVRERLQSTWETGRRELDYLHHLLRQLGSHTKTIQESLDSARALVASVSEGWNTDKPLEAAAAYSMSVEGDVAREMEDFSLRLASWYYAKPGDVVDELLANLRFPSADRETSRQALAAIANAMAERPEIVEEFGSTLAELLVLRQYTQKPIDIDRDIGWAGVPPPSHGYEEARALYETSFSDWNWDDPSKRNGSLFGPVCAALRDQGPGGRRAAWSEEVLKRWIKWTCTVAAVCATDTEDCADPDDELWRGLGGGGLPSHVVESHRELETGFVIGWPALSSTSFDRKASIEYMRGEAVNSTSKPNERCPGTILFRLRGVRTGRVLQTISQYPAERELLLGPFTLFHVQSVQPDPANPFRNGDNEPMGLFIDLLCLGTNGRPLKGTRLGEFLTNVRGDAVLASRKLTLKDERSLVLDWILSKCNAPRDVVHQAPRLLQNCSDPTAFIQLLDDLDKRYPIGPSPTSNPLDEAAKALDGLFPPHMIARLQRTAPDIATFVRQLAQQSTPLELIDHLGIPLPPDCTAEQLAMAVKADRDEKVRTALHEVAEMLALPPQHAPTSLARTVQQSIASERRKVCEDALRAFVKELDPAFADAAGKWLDLCDTSSLPYSFAFTRLAQEVATAQKPPPDLAMALEKKDEEISSLKAQLRRAHDAILAVAGKDAKRDITKEPPRRPRPQAEPQQPPPPPPPPVVPLPYAPWPYGAVEATLPRPWSLSVEFK